MSNDKFADLISIADKAYQSLLFEVNLTPKPGLVDAKDNGSHSDMDISTFKASSDSLKEHFQNYIRIGYEHEGNVELLFAKLREEGKLAEESMFEVTGGINTHKGANFSFALFLGAIGYLLKSNEQVDFVKLFQTITILSSGLMTDFEKESMTNGIKVYKLHGSLGIRGEAIGGYPTIQSLYKKLIVDESDTYFWQRKLLEIILETEDANLLHRGGTEGLKYAEKLTRKALDSDGNFENVLLDLNEQFVKRNLSPGGSADLLAILYFLNSLNIVEKS